MATKTTTTWLNRCVSYLQIDTIEGPQVGPFLESLGYNCAIYQKVGLRVIITVLINQTFIIKRKPDGILKRIRCIENTLYTAQLVRTKLNLIS